MEHRTRNFIAGGVVGLGTLFFGVLYNISKAQHAVPERDAVTIVSEYVQSIHQSISSKIHEINNWPQEYKDFIAYDLIAMAGLVVVLGGLLIAWKPGNRSS